MVMYERQIIGEVLSDEECARYNIQMALSEVGKEGQKLLKQSRVAIIGAGGLGCPVSLYLTAAGIGYIRLIDNDKVSLGNLHRQILHYTDKIGEPKVYSAQSVLHAINPQVEIEPIEQKIDSHSAMTLTEDVDIIIDCCDNFETRYILNAVAIKNKKRFCSASVYKYNGHLTIFSPDEDTPCYQCLFPIEKPSHMIPNNSEIGVWSPLVGIMGCLQADLVLRALLRLGECNYGKLVIFNALNATMMKIKFPRRNDCPSCSVN
jgi:molybdopterin/thiamine biosynthesis adenylyltransferase